MSLLLVALLACTPSLTDTAAPEQAAPEWGVDGFDTGWEETEGLSPVETPTDTDEPIVEEDTDEPIDTAPPPEEGEVLCSDGEDNDSDGLLDCEDAGCFEATSCVETLCDDGLDNDGDGAADCWDDDCWVDHCEAVSATYRVTGGAMIGRHVENEPQWGRAFHGGFAGRGDRPGSRGAGGRPRSWSSSSYYSSSWGSWSSWSSSYYSSWHSYSNDPLDRVDVRDVTGVAQVLVQPGSELHSCTWTVDRVMKSEQGAWDHLRRNGFGAQQGCGLLDTAFLPQQLGIEEGALRTPEGLAWYAGEVGRTGTFELVRSGEVHANSYYGYYSYTYEFDWSDLSSWWEVDPVDVCEVTP